jgi:hypothetical protein
VRSFKTQTSTNPASHIHGSKTPYQEVVEEEGDMEREEELESKYMVIIIMFTMEKE